MISSAQNPIIHALCGIGQATEVKLGPEKWFNGIIRLQEVFGQADAVWTSRRCLDRQTMSRS